MLFRNKVDWSKRKFYDGLKIVKYFNYYHYITLNQVKTLGTITFIGNFSVKKSQTMKTMFHHLTFRLVY